MDSSAFRNFDLGGVIWWAIFGMACAALLALGGICFALWWAYHHVQIV